MVKHERTTDMLEQECPAYLEQGPDLKKQTVGTNKTFKMNSNNISKALHFIMR